MTAGVGPGGALWLVCFLVIPAKIDSRQMCWTCQYVQNGAGKEQCSISPGNWTGGDPRIKCESKCIISAEFDAVTGEPTFFYRGCVDTSQKNGCTDNGSKHYCFFSCEGTHYCNDKPLPRSTLMSKKAKGAAQLMRPWELLYFVTFGFICSHLVKLI